MSLICTGCGKEIETLPLQSAHKINMNNETNQLECYIENFGTILINEFVCERCSTNRNIMKSVKSFERLSLENEEFKEELTFFQKNIVQTKLLNTDFNFWIEFGNGVYLSGKGVKINPSIFVTCPQKAMNLILEGNLDPDSLWLTGDLQIEGDLQYAGVFFDLMKLALEIIRETGGV